jgi:hypothetical protein
MGGLSQRLERNWNRAGPNLMISGLGSVVRVSADLSRKRISHHVHGNHERKNPQSWK